MKATMPMVRALCLAVISIFCLSVPTVPVPSMAADSLASYPEDIQRIKQRGKLVVAMYGKDMPPFFMHTTDDGFFGYDVDLAQAIANSLGVKLEFNRDAASFNQVVMQVENRKADIAISKLSKTSDRAQKILFSNTYTTILQVLLVHRINKAKLDRGDDAYQALNTPEAKIAVVAQTSYVGYAQRDFPNAKIVPYEDRNVAFQDLLDAKLHAMLIDESTVKNWFHKMPEAGIEIQTVVRKDRIDPKAMAVHSGDAHLLNWINTVLELNLLDGTSERLHSTYLTNEDWRNKTK